MVTRIRLWVVLIVCWYGTMSYPRDGSVYALALSMAVGTMAFVIACSVSYLAGRAVSPAGDRSQEANGDE